jgi:hypothetical protein
MLRVVGPVSVPGVPDPMTVQTVGRQLLHDLYQNKLGDKTAGARQNAVTAAATKAVVDRLTHGSVDALALGSELGDAAKGGHLKLYSTNPADERELERVGLGGGPATADADRTFHVAVESRAATKLDYYVRPSVKQHVTLDRNGTAVVRTTISVTNKAPVGSSPNEQLGPGDPATRHPGDYNAWVLLWGPAGSTQDASLPESGLQLTQTVLLVPAGTTQTAAVVETVIPNAVRDGRLELRYVPQPRLNPIDITVDLQAPGWRVDGNRSRRVNWNSIVRVEWDVVR